MWYNAWVNIKTIQIFLPVAASLVWFGIVTRMSTRSTSVSACPACDQHGASLTRLERIRALSIATGLRVDGRQITLRSSKGEVILTQRNNAQGLPESIRSKYGLFRYHYDESGKISLISRVINSKESNFLIPKYLENKLQGVYSVEEKKYRSAISLPHLDKQDPAIVAIRTKLAELLQRSSASSAMFQGKGNNTGTLIASQADVCQLCITQYDNCVSGAQAVNKACGLGCTASFFAYVASCALLPPPADIICWGVGLAAEIACFNICSAGYNTTVTGCQDTLNICNAQNNCGPKQVETPVTLVQLSNENTHWGR